MNLTRSASGAVPDGPDAPSDPGQSPNNPQFFNRKLPIQFANSPSTNLQFAPIPHPVDVPIKRRRTRALRTVAPFRTGYAVAPNGDFVICNVVSEAVEPITIVQGWAAALRR
jgi:hypothetical protein